MNKIDSFLLGFIAMACTTAALFFIKFWRSTRDTLFFAFSAFFVVEAADRVALLLSHRPNEGTPWIYILRLAALVFLVAVILKKNYGRKPQR